MISIDRYVGLRVTFKSGRKGEIYFTPDAAPEQIRQHHPNVSEIKLLQQELFMSKVPKEWALID